MVNSTALIPYTPRLTPKQFIASVLINEIKKGSLSLTQLRFKEDPFKQRPKIERFSFTESTYIKLNVDEIVEILFSEAAFTTATNKKPIVATYGSNPCVAFGGYDPTNKIAFMVHFCTAAEVNLWGEMIFLKISKIAKEKFEKPIQIHLRSGKKEDSNEALCAIKSLLKARNDIPMEIASEEAKTNLLIDARTGYVAGYDCKANPKSRGIPDYYLDDNFAKIKALFPQITLVYSP